MTVLISWPGHLSYDSVIQLHDGRTGYYHSWHPPVMAWLLGLGDTLHPGAGLFVLFNSALFFGALLSLLWLRRGVSWTAVVVGVILVLLPQAFLYQTTVWKDVLFANAAVAGFVCLAHAEGYWRHRSARLCLVAGSVALLSLAALTRQNGAIVLVIGVIALGMIAGRKFGAKGAIIHGAVALIGSTLVVFLASSILAKRSDNGEGPRAQLRLLRLYDLSGAVAAQSSLPLSQLEATNPELAKLIRSDGARLYTPQRNDTLVGSQPLQNALADTEPAWMAAQWYDLIGHHPLLYLKVRAVDFGWVFLTPDIAACRPVFVGVEGPLGEMQELGLAPRKDGRDLALQSYASKFMGTPVFSHVFYAVLALGALIVFVRRRGPGDIAMAAMIVAALVFTASFFVISIACDYRYLYFLDLAAMGGIFYLTLDPDYLFQVVAMWSGSFWELRSEARKS
ncbi:MAG TPA: hypothetical protein VHE09_08020 [Rhizomicrobium sp.]|nr:hypothetical protein [Rhizomicrobium sp.]